jgi:hypothetical protein
MRAASGQCEVLPKGRLALGVMENTAEENLEIQLEPDDCLLLYTDGVTESFSPDSQQFGVENLCQVLAHAIGRSASQVLNQIDRPCKNSAKASPPATTSPCWRCAANPDSRPLFTKSLPLSAAAWGRINTFNL